jgi:hypothetical protein
VRNLIGVKGKTSLGDALASFLGHLFSIILEIVVDKSIYLCNTIDIKFGGVNKWKSSLLT